jgi:hypothetical protein
MEAALGDEVDRNRIDVPLRLSSFATFTQHHTPGETFIINRSFDRLIILE